MARTHRSQDDDPTLPTVLNSVMPPKHGAVVGNYVTFLLLAQAAGVQSADTTVTRIPMLQPFRVSGVSFAHLGQTANVTAKVVKNNVVADVIASSDADAAPSARVATSALPGIGAKRGTSLRDLGRGDTLDLILTHDGTGVAASGSVAAWVTGYFTDHVSNRAPWAQRGQSRLAGPAAGFYDVLALYNLRANANQAARSECELFVPYNCRVIAAHLDLRGHTETTGTITGDLRKNGATILGAALDWDANDQFLIDADSTPTFVSSAARDFVQGDALSLYLSSGLDDSVPVGMASAHVLVWVKGHVSALQAED